MDAKSLQDLDRRIHVIADSALLEHFLRWDVGHPQCTSCLSRRFDIAYEIVSKVIANLRITPGFAVRPDRCVFCEKLVVTIKAVPATGGSRTAA